MGTPTAGLAAPLPKTGIKGSVEGIVAEVDDGGSGTTYSGGANAEFAYAPSTDDGNALTDDGGASSNGLPAATDDGGASGDFRRLEEEGFFEDEETLAPLESTEIDVIGERPGVHSKAHRGLKGVLVSTSPIPARLST